MIPYRVVMPKNGAKQNASILLLCPICGEWGRLLADGVQFSGHAYKIKHDNSTWCHIAASHPRRPEVDEVYMAVRRGEHDTVCD